MYQLELMLALDILNILGVFIHKPKNDSNITNKPKPI